MGKQLIFTGNKYQEFIEKSIDVGQTNKVLLICGSSIQQQPINEYLTQISKPVIRFSDFRPNPEFDSVLKAIKVLRQEECNCIVAVGGGSAIDIAKCVKRFAYSKLDNGLLEDNCIEENGIKLVAIPTTAGTGSESTTFAVVYLQGKKYSVNHPSLLPEYVLLCPELLESLPFYQRKVTFLDALAHSIESYWSLKSNDESKKYAAEAIRLIYQYKDAYLVNEKLGNENMLSASNLAGKAINITQTTAGHAMSYKMTSLYRIAHGHAAILCIPKIWNYMLAHNDACVDKRGKEYFIKTLDELSKIMGYPSVDMAIEGIENLISLLGLKVFHSNMDKDIPLLVESVNIERLKNNPVQLTKEDLYILYEQILKDTTPG